MERLIWHIIAGVLTIFLAIRFVPGVTLEIIPGESSFLGMEITKEWQIIVLIGIILGLINVFIKPILDKLTWPLKILTLGIFSLVLNMGIIWFLDISFEELKIVGLQALFFTTIIVWAINFFLGVKK
jgi:putative membrane protein